MSLAALQSLRSLQSMHIEEHYYHVLLNTMQRSLNIILNFAILLYQFIEPKRKCYSSNVLICKALTCT